MSGAGYGRIGNYELRGILGRGGMATVYRAYSPTLRRDVALKVLTAPEDKLDLLRERFRREAQTIGRLQHPHILSLVDSGEEHGIPYLVMELIEGGALSSRLGQPLPPREALTIAQQIGRALDYAHAQGVIHRDVKPANIFLRPSAGGTYAVLADFGIARVLGDLGPRLTQTGVGVGTPEYTAPEQALGAAIDGRSDLYSLAVVLYEMLTGKPPYQGGTMDVINAHVQGQLPDPRERNPALPPAVSAVLVQALARDPNGRYRTGAALIAALEDALTGTRSVSAPPIADAPSPTMLLQQTREMMLRTQLLQGPPVENLDATSIVPSPGQAAPPRPTPPTPAALPSVPLQPTTPPGSDVAARGDTSPPTGRHNTPTPEPPRTLPPTPLAGSEPATQRPEAGRDSGVFAPPQQAWPPLPPAPLSQYQQAPQLTAPTYAPTPLYQPPTPVSPPPSLPQRRNNLPLLIGLAAAVIVLLVLASVGGIYLVRRNTDTTPPTVTIAAASPNGSAAPSVAGASGTLIIAGATPSTPPAAITATAALAADPAREQIIAGEAALQGGQFPQAVAAYKSALATNPQSAIANRQLGLALWVWNHEPGEIGYLDQATRLDPNDAIAWAYLSFSSVDTHQVERAYASAQRAVAANDKQPEAFAAIANAYIRYPPEPANPESGKREAREAINRAKQLDPDNLWVLWVEHVVLTSEGNTEAALVPLDRMIAQRPNWATLYYAKGGLVAGLDRPDEARTWQEKALSLDPEYPYALTELGWLAYREDDYPRAREFFDRALVLTDDTNDSAHIGLGYTLLQLGDSGNALPHCQRATGIDTRLPGGYSCLGDIYRSGTRQYSEALVAYRKVIELRPYWEDGHIGTARVQEAQGDYAAAEATLKQGIARIAKPRYVHYWLGWMQYQQKKYGEAQPNFEKAAALAPNDQYVQYQLGQNLEQLQRFPEARAAYERALAIDPNFDAAKRALERLQQQGN